jgi:hypothetical protein
MKRTLTIIAALAAITLTTTGCAGLALMGGTMVVAGNKAIEYKLSLPRPLDDEMRPAADAASAPITRVHGLPTKPERQLLAAAAADRALEVIIAGRSNTMTEVAAQRLAGNKDYQPASTCKIVPVSETVFDIVC